MPKTRVDVTINSRQYTVIANESDEYIMQLAEHIDEKVQTVLKGGQNIMGERPVVLAALNICDEYYKCVDASEVLKGQIRIRDNKIGELNRQLENVKAGAQQISFDESEAERKIADTKREADLLRERLLKATDELENAKKQIAELKEKISLYEKGKTQSISVKHGAYNGYGKKN